MNIEELKKIELKLMEIQSEVWKNITAETYQQMGWGKDYPPTVQLWLKLKDARDIVSGMLK